MIRKFNYTNRYKIARESVDIKISKISTKSFLHFNLDKTNLKFPDTSKVYVEAFYGPDSIRFDFGTFSHTRPPSDTDISSISNLSDRIYFHLKIVDERNDVGLILGECKIYDLTDEKAPAGKTCIFGVANVKIDTDEIWRVNLDRNQEMPVLEVNQRIEGIQEMAKNDRSFIALVYPSAIRRILEFIQNSQDADLDSESWCSKWLVFGEKLAGRKHPSDNDDDEWGDWIDSVISRFNSNNATLEGFLNDLNL